MKFDVIIIGAGAAGLMTAISTNRHHPNAKILLLDSSPFPGKKILMSGGGRCNVTNAELDFKNYFGESPNAIKKVILQFPPKDVVRLFEDEGVQLKIEKPWFKYFPVSNQAKTILDVLLGLIKRKSIQRAFGETVLSFSLFTNQWKVVTPNHDYITDKLVLASGGFSYPHTGSDGRLWKLAEKMGISIVKEQAALTPLKTSDNIFHLLSGLTIDCQFKIYGHSKLIFTEINSLLFTHDGLSGPGILNISHWFTTKAPNNVFKLEISFLPESNEDIFLTTLKLTVHQQPKQKIETFLQTLLPIRLSETLCHLSQCPNKPLNQLTTNDKKNLTRLLFHFEPNISGHFGFKKAEVTAGGIPFSEINLKTMELKRFPGLYAVGEIVNVHGIVGGYNFQWAWSSGWVCGKNL